MKTDETRLNVFQVRAWSVFITYRVLINLEIYFNLSDNAG